MGVVPVGGAGLEPPAFTGALVAIVGLVVAGLLVAFLAGALGTTTAAVGAGVAAGVDLEVEGTILGAVGVPPLGFIPRTLDC